MARQGGEIAIGPFTLDTQECVLRRGRNEYRLRPKAFELLIYLTARPNRLVSLDELRTQLWPDSTVAPTAINKLVSEVRKALDDGRGTKYIDTIARRGYRFVSHATLASDATVDSSSDANRPATHRPALSAPDPCRMAAAEIPSAVGVESGLRPASAIFVGRGSELSELQQRWQQSRAGQRQVVFISGPPGIGKSALIETFVRSLQAGNQAAPLDDPSVRGADGLRASATAPIVMRGECLHSHGESEPYLPLLDAIEKLAQRTELTDIFRRYAPSWLAQIPWLVSGDELVALRQALQGVGSARMLREGVRLFEALAQVGPVMLVLEDMHWSDPATLDLLTGIATRTQPSRLMLLASYRPTEVVLSRHPIGSFVSQALLRFGSVSRLKLESLPQSELSSFLVGRFGNPELARRLAPVFESKTGGNPLFAEALASDMVDRGWLMQRQDGWHVTIDPAVETLHLPDGVRELIGSQISRLPGEAQSLLEVASIIGKSFRIDELAAVAEREATEVERLCEELARDSHFLSSEGTEILAEGKKSGRYSFAHSLIEQALSERVPPARSQMLHGRVATQLEATAGERIVDLAPRLAFHWEAAGNIEKQVIYLDLSTAQALWRYAYREAAGFVERVIVALQKLPATPERLAMMANRELRLANLRIWLHGYADSTAHTRFCRARDLARGAADFVLEFRAQLGICVTHVMAGNPQAHDVSRWLIAASDSHAELATAAHLYAAYCAHSNGDVKGTLQHVDAGLASLPRAAEDIPAHTDKEAMLGVIGTLALVQHGGLDRASELWRRTAERLVTRAQPFQAVIGLGTLACGALEAGELESALEIAEHCRSVSRESGIETWVTLAHCVREAVLAMQDVSHPLAEFETQLDSRLRLHEFWFQAFFYGKLADAYRIRGDFNRALECLDRTEVPGSYEAEAWRIRGAILQSASDHGAALQDDVSAEEYLRRAIDIARSRDAKLYELYATTDLARLLACTNREPQARRALEDIYARFTEGFDRMPLQSARRLLEELSAK